MASHRVSRRIAAPAAQVYSALVDPRAVEQWRAPEGMTCQVHELDPTIGGLFRVSLTYLDGRERGKSGVVTDTYEGRFAELVPGRKVVEVVAFETEVPELSGEFTVTTVLSERSGETVVTVEFEGLPTGVDPSDNEMGTAMALAKLAALVESESTP